MLPTSQAYFVPPLLLASFLLLTSRLTVALIHNDAPVSVDVQTGFWWHNGPLWKHFKPDAIGKTNILPIPLDQGDCFLSLRDDQWTCTTTKTKYCQRGVAVITPSRSNGPVTLSYYRFNRLKPSKTRLTICAGDKTKMGKIIGRPVFFYSEQKHKDKESFFQGLKMPTGPKARYSDWSELFVTDYVLDMFSTNQGKTDKQGNQGKKVFWTKEAQQEVNKKVVKISFTLKVEEIGTPSRPKHHTFIVGPAFVPLEPLADGVGPLVWLLEYNHSSQKCQLMPAPRNRKIKEYEAGVGIAMTRGKVKGRDVVSMWSYERHPEVSQQSIPKSQSRLQPTAVILAGKSVFPSIENDLQLNDPPPTFRHQIGPNEWVRLIIDHNGVEFSPPFGKL